MKKFNYDEMMKKLSKEKKKLKYTKGDDSGDEEVKKEADSDDEPEDLVQEKSNDDETKVKKTREREEDYEDRLSKQMRGMAILDDLPFDVWTHVGSFFDLSSYAKMMRLNKTYYDIMTNLPEGGKYLPFTLQFDSKNKTEIIVNIDEAYTRKYGLVGRSIKDPPLGVSFLVSKDNSDIFMTNIATAIKTRIGTHIEQIFIASRYHGYDPTPVLEALTHHNHIQRLHILGATISNSLSRAIIKMLETNKSLKTLDIISCSKGDTDIIPTISKGLSKNNTLKELLLLSGPITNLALKLNQLKKSLEHNSSLKSFYFVYTGSLTPEELKILGELVVQCKLGSFGITSDEIKRLDVFFNEIYEKNSLVELEVKNGSFDTKTTDLLTKCIKKSRTLKELSIASKSMSLESGNELFASIRDSKSIETVTFDCPSFKIERDPIIKMIEKNKNLKKVDVTKCIVETEVYEEMLMILSTRPKL